MESVNLRDFAAAGRYPPRILAEGKALFQQGLVDVTQQRWERSVGPVWVLSDPGFTVIVGFQPDSEGIWRRDWRGWRVITDCYGCDLSDCVHSAALATWVEANQKPLLTRWQEHLEAFASQYGRQLLSRLPDLPDPRHQFQRWIAAQSSSASIEREIGARASPRLVQDAEPLVFVLQRGDAHRRSAEIRIGRARALKGKPGQLTKLTSVAPSELRHHTGFDPIVRRVLQWAAINGIGSADDEVLSFAIRDESGLETLQAIAEANRLFGIDQALERPVGPIRWAEPRRLGWSWSEDQSGLLHVKPEHNGAHLYFHDGASLYLDASSRTVGTLDLDGLTPARALAMLSVPPIPKDWLSQHSQSPDVIRCLPRPPAHLVRRSDRVISGIPPVPQLTVGVAGKEEVFRLALSYRYGDLARYFRPGTDPIAFITVGRETLELVRDISAEGAALRVLAAEGLELADGAGSLRFPGGASEQVAGFRNLLASDFARFREAGFEIKTVDEWSTKVINATDVKGGFADGDSYASNPRAFLQFSIGFFIDGQRYNLLPLIPQLLTVAGGAEGIAAMSAAREKDPQLSAYDPTLWVVDGEGRWIGLPRAQLAPWLGTLAELVAERRPKELAGQSLRVSRIEALRLEASRPDVSLGGDAAEIVEELLTAKADQSPIELPAFQGELKAFQMAGVRWLGVLAKYQLGGMLGDDRGLGKTWQCIAHLADLKHRGALQAPALIVVPPTQLHHWRHFLTQLAPSLSVLILQGTERRTLVASMSEFDAVLTSWDSVVRYVEQLCAQHFQVGFFDEAEKLHQAVTQMARGVRLLDIGYRIAIDGSPLENNYSDYWAVIDAVLPGYLGTDAAFKRNFRVPIEGGSVDRLKALRLRTAPFVLRRLKGESGVELPPVIHQDVALELSGDQANLYEVIRLTTEESVMEAMETGGFKRNHKSILAKLIKLRQVCCDPSLTEVGRNQGLTGSAKLDWLGPQLDQMLGDGRKVLLVGYFVEFFQLIEAMLFRKGIAYSKIVGTMSPAKREAEKVAFKGGHTNVFLLGLKSGGRGADLPEADTVIHLDPWYNPKAHDQATDRAHRMGQRNTVLSLRLFVQGSIEERVLQIQDRKRLFADSLDSEEIFDEHQVTREDIIEMLKPLEQMAEGRA